MSIPVVLGVDVGTSSSKAVLVTLDGRILRSAARAHSVDRPSPGQVEMSADVWWQEFVDMSTELTMPGDIEVVAVGVSGMGPCVLVTDEQSRPLRPAILYGVDTRATAQIDALNAALDPAEILDRCGSALSTQAVGPKLAWLREHEPDVFNSAKRLFMPSSWLVYQLTGSYVLDYHSASQCTPMFDTGTLSWYRPWADLIAPGIALPPLRWPGEQAGSTSRPVAGIAAGVPVITGTIDAWSEALSVGAHGVGDLMLMYGTTMFLISTVKSALTSESMWGTVGALEGTRNLAGGMATSGAITGWLRELVGSPDYATLLAEADASGPGARGLLVLPYFAGERTPIMDPDARGVIAGLTLTHTRGDLYRAVLEAVAFGVRHNIDVMRAAGAVIDRVVAVGGGTQGGLWTQIVSDVTGMTQVIPTTTVGASYGAALLAAQLEHDVSITDWNPAAGACRPNGCTAAAYDDLYQLYLNLYPVSREIVHALGAFEQTDLSRRRTPMSTYRVPAAPARPAKAPKTAYLIPSGDLRESANVAGWPTQEDLERVVEKALAEEGWTVVRALGVDPLTGHGFITSQRMGLEVFKTIPVDAPLIVATAIWQYSHHVLGGLRTHRGPILTIANFSGEWPGLVGLLGLNAGLTKMDKAYSTIWTVDGTDQWFKDGICSWLETGSITHDDSHVRELPALPASAEKELGEALADQLLADKAIIGVFDEGCMGMYNAIIDDELLNPIGIYKERLSQSSLWAEMQTVTDAEASAVGAWLTAAGMKFKLGTDEKTELTEAQLTWQYKMYIAALRISDDFGLDAVGIQYQQGLKDLSPASDLVEGLVNNVQRPPATSRDGSRVLYADRALPNFNEADEGIAVDSLITNRVWTAMDLDPANTLHDVRWGEQFGDQFVWVYEISGSVPPSHLVNGYASAVGWRQNPVFFPAGGSTIKGVSKPGEIVWSRVYIAHGELNLDMGRASVVELPEAETERRWNATNPEWPIAHVVLHGVSRDQFMARHKANHALIVYAPDAATADKALLAKAALFARLGVRVHLCGTVDV